MGRQIKNHKAGELHYYIQWLLGMMQLAASIWWDYGVFLLYYWWFIYRCCVPFKTFLVDCPASHVWLPDQLISVGITWWQNHSKKSPLQAAWIINVRRFRLGEFWRSEWKPAPCALKLGCVGSTSSKKTCVLKWFDRLTHVCGILWLVSGSRKDGGPTKSHMGRAAWWIFTLPDVKYQLTRILLHDLHDITIYYM
jgi:hypothetical protein